MRAIEDRLRGTIGLDPSSIGPNLIESLVYQRMNRLGLSDAGEYGRLLERSAQEWNELVVVTETWFFRDHEPFRAFARLVRERWLPTHQRGMLRVLSVPCSSGEEP